MGSDFAHRYAEGHPGERYYQGTEIIDEIESLLKQHMKSLFHCKHADVRPISGTIANDAVFSRYIRPGDIVMVNSTPAGGHISHHRAGSVGKYTKNIVNFPLTADGWHIDVEHTLDLMKALEPKVMIMGKSLFLFPEPVKELAPYCKKKGIHLIYDAAHVLGLIAGDQFQDPLGGGRAPRDGKHAQDLLRLAARRDPLQPRRRGVAQDRQGRLPRLLLQSPPGDARGADVRHLRDAGVRRGVRAAGRGEREALRAQALRPRVQGARRRSSASPRATRWPST